LFAHICGPAIIVENVALIITYVLRGKSVFYQSCVRFCSAQTMFCKMWGSHDGHHHSLKAKPCRCNHRCLSCTSLFISA
jgi:hypothetical protein